MLDLYALARLVPYVFAFLSEVWKRTESRTWSRTQGTVTGGSIEGIGFPYTATLHYEYWVGTAHFFGCISRRCLRRRSAEAVTAPTRTSPIQVRFQTARPERSYVALPLGWGGFVFTAVPVFGFAAFLAFLAFALVQDRYIESHDAIRSSDWRLFAVPTAFQVELPGPAIPTSKPLLSLNVGGIAPSSTGWVFERDGAYFYAGVLQYPEGTTPKPEILE